MSELPPPIPAATLVLMRPREGKSPALLMMERPGHMAFAAGALVFPGGRIEAQDRAAAARFADGGDDAAARIAAIRETLEETGIAAGIAPAPGADAAGRIRAALIAGGDFAELLAGEGFRIDLDRLVPFARWCPNFRETRRFDALFYLAEAPADGAEPTAQTGEATRVFWAGADEVLAELAAERAHAIFPTRRNLERLAQYPSFAAATADASRHPVRTITPWVEQRNGVAWLRIPDDLGYPVTAELLETAKRR